jgi:hypothetical protein
VLVDGDTVTPLVAGADLAFVVAWLPEPVGDSGEYHRARAPDPAGMRELARIARVAADAFTAGDAVALEACMDQSAHTRDEVAPLPPAHNALVEIFRSRGLAPNSTGSGGAVVALLR